MLLNISKEIVLEIINTNEFKHWLKNRRWFGEKNLPDFDIKLNSIYIVPNEFISPHDCAIIFTVININSNKESNYFLPLCILKSFDSLDEESSTLKLIEQKCLILDLSEKTKELILFEAEFFPDFWKILFSNFNKLVEINFEIFSEKFKNLLLDDFQVKIKELGDAKTTNIVLKLEIDKPNDKNNTGSLNQLVVKSYRKYAPHIEVEMLKTLNNNSFNAAPNMLGLISFKEYNVLNFMNFIENEGDVGLIYWNELNDLFDFYLNNPDELNEINFVKNTNLLELKLKDYCKNSIQFSEKLGNFLKHMHQCLINNELNEFSLEKIDHETETLILEQFKSLLSDIINGLNFSKELEIIKNEEIIASLVNISSIMDNKDYFLKIKDIKTQRIHQDLHMAQILISKLEGNSELIITDFEGDPQLSIMEQKRKYPIEKDLASLLRSFDYIKLLSLIGVIKYYIKETSDQISKKILLSFYKKQKPIALLEKDYIFLKNLVKVGDFWQSHISDLISIAYYKSEEIFQMKKFLINFFSIQRCLMELNYEINFRPENIMIPFLGLKKILLK